MDLYKHTRHSVAESHAQHLVAYQRPRQERQQQVELLEIRVQPEDFHRS